MGRCIAILLAAFAAAFGGQFSAGQQSQIMHSPHLPDLPPIAEASIPQEQFIPYWTSDAGWHSDVMLRNNLASEPLSVTPIVRTAEGREIPLAPVSIRAGEVLDLDLHELLMLSHPEVMQTSQPFGSVRLKYSSPSEANLYASVMIHDNGHPLIYHLDGTTIANEFKRGSREGIWWLPNETADGHLILSNLSTESQSGTLMLHDDLGRSWQEHITLPARTTDRLQLRQLVIRSQLTGSFGGISFIADRCAGCLDSALILFDEQAGFSATMKMFDHNPSAELASRDFAGSGRWTSRAPMLALEHPDPALQLPSDVQLHPQLFLHNTKDIEVHVDVTLHWHAASASGRTAPIMVALRPHETRLIDIGKMQDDGLISMNARWAQITLACDGSPDDVVAVASSYDQSLRYGAQTPFSDQMAVHLEGGEWLVDSYHDSIIAAGNGTSHAVKAQLTLLYEHGQKRYRLEPTIPADDQVFVDVGQLIREQVPDIYGTILPATLDSGAYQLMDISSPPTASLYEGKVVTDKHWGSATYGCMICCGDANLIPNPAQLFVAVTTDSFLGIGARDSCSGSPIDATPYFSNWNMNTAILTRNSSTYMAHGVAPGRTFIQGIGKNIPAARDAGSRQPCPVMQATIPSNGEVAPTLVESVSLWFFGLGVPTPPTFSLGSTQTAITAQGASGGSFSWSLSDGSKATFASDQSLQATTTTTSNSVQVYGRGFSTSLKDETITLQWTPSGGVPTTSSLAFTVDSPYDLSSLGSTGPDAVSTCDPTYTPGNIGWHSRYNWQMLSRFGTPLLGASLNENFDTLVDYQPNNYSFTPNGFAGNPTSNSFHDDYCFANNIAARPPTEIPQNPLTNNLVDSATQYYNVGSSSVGSGVTVQSQTLSRYVDHPTVTNVRSPVRSN